jgi:uncharacterized membrane protein YcaP (DUF421 family)
MNSFWIDYAMVPAVALAAYAWLIFVLRVTGKRTLSKLNAFDFSITVAFGSALATIIIDQNTGILRGCLALAVLALLQYVVTKLSLWSKLFRTVVRSRPTLLVENGRVFPKAMSYERVTRDEIAEAVRNHGYGQLDAVGVVVLETDGSFSVIKKAEREYDLLYDVRRLGEPQGRLVPSSSDGDAASARKGSQPKKEERT